MFFFLPAVQFLDLKVRVKVQDDALQGLWSCNDPAAVLVRRVLERVPGRGDVPSVAGIKKTAARFRRCGMGKSGRGLETEIIR